MNPWQMAQQIKHVLGNMTWGTGSNAPVFGTRNVFVYAGSTPSEEELSPAFPMAFITIDAATPDTDSQDYLLQTFTIVSVVESAGDPLGEFAVIGSSRADLGKSAGAGVAEVAERVRNALQFLAGTSGGGSVMTAVGTTAPQSLGRGRHLAFDQINLTVTCSSQPFYAPPQQLVYAANTFTWVGSHCSSRFDFLRYRVGYVGGSTPASNPADATILYTGTSPTYAVGSLLANTTYSVWADYSPRSTGAVVGSSDGATVGSYWPR